MFKGLLQGCAVVVPNPEDAKRLYLMGFYGRFIGEDKVRPEDIDRVKAPLQLSPIETLYLIEKGLLEVYKDGRKISRDELVSIGRSCIENFDQIYAIYKELRDCGFIVKSGLKFGALFAVYEKGPGLDHAPLLLHFIEPRRAITALDITRAARLSHSVNKMFVLATQNEADGRVYYIAFEWWRA